MVVDRHGVGTLDAVEQVPVPERRQEPAAIRGVDVQPDPLASADVADRGQRVDAAEVGGAGGRDDGDGDEPGGVAARELLLEGVDAHLLGVVARHADDRVGGEAQDPGALLHAEVADVAHEDPHPLPVDCREPVHGRRLVAGEQQRLQVGLAAAAREDAVRVVAEAGAARGPVDERALDEGRARALVPRVHRRVDAGEDELPRDRRDEDRAVEVRDVRRVVEPHRVTEVQVVELVEGVVEAAERAVEVEAREGPAEALGRDAGERAVGAAGGPADVVGGGAEGGVPAGEGAVGEELGGGISIGRDRVGAGVVERRIGGTGGVRGEGHGSFVGSMGSRVRVTSTLPG